MQDNIKMMQKHVESIHNTLGRLRRVYEETGSEDNRLTSQYENLVGETKQLLQEATDADIRVLSDFNQALSGEKIGTEEDYGLKDFEIDHLRGKRY